MAMAINRSNIESLLRPGAHTVFGDYNIYPQLWKGIYSQHRSDKAVEYDIEMQGLPLAMLKQDGAPISAGTMNQAYTSSYVNQYYGISFVITRASIMDNQYPHEFPQQAMQLRNSLDTLKNINAAYIFNNAFNPNVVVSDGQPLCSVSHPISNGVLANTFPQGVQFNEAAVEDIITMIKGWSNVAGLRINLSSIKVLIPQNLAFQASRIFNSDFQPDTGNNAINPLKHDKYMPGGIIVNQFLDNPNSWFVLTDEANGFKYFLREPLDIDFITDPITDNVTVRAVERYSFGNSNWRAVAGSMGA